MRLFADQSVPTLTDHGHRTSRIEISKQALNFSIGHFTIFSETERENLHGHNFQLECELTAPVGPDGLMFDYAILKNLLRALCDEIDEQVILPANSPFLTVEQDEDYVVARFAGERIPFLHRDVTLLPVANVSVEELSRYFLDRLLVEPALAGKGIIAITVKISSSPGQFGVATWSDA
ncbi:MAG: 6-carboxytetrahydropterin synthase [Pseudomonadales bacterium]|nr:6-carboxytetrahydropterin synthase [Pseudomonadales bacterium]